MPRTLLEGVCSAGAGVQRAGAEGGPGEKEEGAQDGTVLQADPAGLWPPRPRHAGPRSAPRFRPNAVRKRTAPGQLHLLAVHKQTCFEERINASMSREDCTDQRNRSPKCALIAEFNRKYRRVSESRQESQW